MLGNCNYQLKVVSSDEFQIENGIDFQFYMQSEDVRVFKFVVPTSQNGADNESGLVPSEGISFLKHLAEEAVVIKASAYRSDAHDFNLMASIKCPQKNETEDLPSTNFESKKGVSAWKKGQVIRIGKDEFTAHEWNNCLIEIVMDVIDSGEYHIMASTSDAVPQLYNQQQIDDIVKFERLQCYKYFVKDAETNFQIYLTTYSGRVDIGV